MEIYKKYENISHSNKNIIKSIKMFGIYMKIYLKLNKIPGNIENE